MERGQRVEQWAEGFFPEGTARDAVLALDGKPENELAIICAAVGTAVLAKQAQDSKGATKSV